MTRTTMRSYSQSDFAALQVESISRGVKEDIEFFLTTSPENLKPEHLVLLAHGLQELLKIASETEKVYSASVIKSPTVDSSSDKQAEDEYRGYNDDYQKLIRVLNSTFYSDSKTKREKIKQSIMPGWLDQMLGLRTNEVAECLPQIKFVEQLLKDQDKRAYDQLAPLLAALQKGDELKIASLKAEQSELMNAFKVGGAVDKAVDKAYETRVVYEFHVLLMWILGETSTHHSEAVDRIRKNPNIVQAFRKQIQFLDGQVRIFPKVIQTLTTELNKFKRKWDIQHSEDQYKESQANLVMFLRQVQGLFSDSARVQAEFAEGLQQGQKMSEKAEVPSLERAVWDKAEFDSRLAAATKTQQVLADTVAELTRQLEPGVQAEHLVLNQLLARVTTVRQDLAGQIIELKVQVRLGQQGLQAKFLEEIEDKVILLEERQEECRLQSLLLDGGNIELIHGQAKEDYTQELETLREDVFIRLQEGSSQGRSFEKLDYKKWAPLIVQSNESFGLQIATEVPQNPELIRAVNLADQVEGMIEKQLLKSNLRCPLSLKIPEIPVQLPGHNQWYDFEPATKVVGKGENPMNRSKFEPVDGVKLLYPSVESVMNIKRATQLLAKTRQKFKVALDERHALTSSIEFFRSSSIEDLFSSFEVVMHQDKSQEIGDFYAMFRGKSYDDSKTDVASGHKEEEQPSLEAQILSFLQMLHKSDDADLDVIQSVNQAVRVIMHKMSPLAVQVGSVLDVLKQSEFKQSHDRSFKVGLGAAKELLKGMNLSSSSVDQVNAFLRDYSNVYDGRMTDFFNALGVVVKASQQIEGLSRQLGRARSANRFSRLNELNQQVNQCARDVLPEINLIGSKEFSGLMDMFPQRVGKLGDVELEAYFGKRLGLRQSVPLLEYFEKALEAATNPVDNLDPESKGLYSTKIAQWYQVKKEQEQPFKDDKEAAPQELVYGDGGATRAHNNAFHASRMLARLPRRESSSELSNRINVAHTMSFLESQSGPLAPGSIDATAVLDFHRFVHRKLLQQLIQDNSHKILTDRPLYQALKDDDQCPEQDSKMVLSLGVIHSFLLACDNSDPQGALANMCRQALPEVMAQTRQQVAERLKQLQSRHWFSLSIDRLTGMKRSDTKHIGAYKALATLLEQKHADAQTHTDIRAALEDFKVYAKEELLADVGVGVPKVTSAICTQLDLSQQSSVVRTMQSASETSKTLLEGYVKAGHQIDPLKVPYHLLTSEAATRFCQLLKVREGALRKRSAAEPLLQVYAMTREAMQRGDFNRLNSFSQLNLPKKRLCQN